MCAYIEATEFAGSKHNSSMSYGGSQNDEIQLDARVNIEEASR